MSTNPDIIFDDNVFARFFLKIDRDVFFTIFVIAGGNKDIGGDENVIADDNPGFVGEKFRVVVNNDMVADFDAFGITVGHISAKTDVLSNTLKQQTIFLPAEIFNNFSKSNN